MVKIIGSKSKSSVAELDYTIDWSKWLETDTISDSSWTIEAAGEVVQTNSTHSATTATIWVDGGVAKTKYTITNTVVTVGGRTDARAFTLTIF